MNIFIDTSVLFTDPFFTELFKKEILIACRNGQLQIYISEVVVKELLHNYEKNLDKIIFDLKNLNTTSQKLIVGFERYHVIDKEIEIKKLQDFLAELNKMDSFHIIPIKNEYLPEILQKAIVRLKPFTEKKTELKDALIWKSYTDMINTEKLKNCFLLTQNVSDFALEVEKKNFILHPDLQNECENITLITNFKDVHKLYKLSQEVNQEVAQNITLWYEKIAIDEHFVFEKIQESFDVTIVDNISNYIDRIDLDQYFGDGHLIRMGGYAEIEDYNWIDCSDIDIEPLEDGSIVISGILNINAEIEGYAYNSVRDDGDDKFPYIGSANVNFKIYFNFLLEQEIEPYDFEITHIEDISN